MRGSFTRSPTISRGRGINIETVDSETTLAPVSGRPLFAMTARVVAPPTVAGQGWEAGLEEIAESHEPGDPGHAGSRFSCTPPPHPDPLPAGARAAEGGVRGPSAGQRPPHRPSGPPLPGVGGGGGPSPDFPR